MATIKGITIQFDGDTVGLDRALKKIKGETKSVDGQLRAVNNALKFNPRNVELLKQKFTLLGQKVEATEAELKQFRQIEAQLKAKNVSEQSAEWMKVRRNIIEAESKLKHFNAELRRAKAANLTALGNGFKTAGQNMRMAGMYASIGAGAMIMAGKKLLQLNETQEQAETKLTEIYKTRMGATEAAAQSTMKLASALQKEGVVGDEVTLSGAQQLATFAKMPDTVNKLLPAMDNLLVQQKGYNATADDAKNIANLFGKAMTGQTGALKRVGISFTEEQEKVLKFGTEEERAAMLSQVVTDNVGNMNKVFAQTDAGKMEQVKNSLSDFGERLGATLLPVLGSVAEWLNNSVLPVIEKIVSFMEAHPVIAKIAVAITALLAIAGPLLIVFGAIASAIGALMPVFAALAGPVGIVIGIIAALVAIGIALYKNWDTIKAKAIAFKNYIVKTFTAIKTNVVKTFNAIKNAMLNPIRAAMNVIKGIINKIKGFFKFKVSLPHIKLPHFSIRPAGWKLSDLLKGKIPSLGIKWYAQGGIVDRPTLAGIGEAGPEAVVPLSGSHMKPFADAIAANMGIDYDALASAIVTALSGVDTSIVMNIDGKRVASTTAPYMNSAINQLQARQARQLGIVGV